MAFNNKENDEMTINENNNEILENDYNNVPINERYFIDTIKENMIKEKAWNPEFFNFFFYAFFCPWTMTTHARCQLIQIYSVDWTDVYDTQH